MIAAIIAARLIDSVAVMAGSIFHRGEDLRAGVEEDGVVIGAGNLLEGDHCRKHGGELPAHGDGDEQIVAAVKDGHARRARARGQLAETGAVVEIVQQEPA